MRVLSRRANLPKAVACGYSEGAGFFVLTEPFPWPLALLLCVRCTTRRRGVGELCSGAPRPCALGCLYTRLPPLAHTQAGPSAQPRRDGVAAATSPRDGVGRVGSQSAWALGAACQVGRPRAISRGRKKRAATASGAGRRLLSTTKTSAPPRRRRLAAALCGFSHRGRGKMALLWRTRDGTSTAARLRRRQLA